MFDKVLIANRGEIAVRVMKTCRDLGIISVAVYSDADADSLHVRTADEAHHLPGNTAAETYLDVEAIMDAVRATGAQAVHPGYGFLSESRLLAEALTREGIAFIGPGPEVIESMGSKISSRRLAAAAGVPGVPGESRALTDVADLARFAESHGWPIAIKASYGGGGRGIRIVSSVTDAAEALESARREAQAYFGNGDVYLERYLERPRHIEVQILADAHGKVLAVGDRDCSVQRRHQKLLEEAPASQLDPGLRARISAAAVAIARQVGYVNAGTVEFLVEDGDFYFLEMNTRLQVEHPVTELVTGIDLVEQQLRIAAGEHLGFNQADLAQTGHAIEIRINAEDPAGGRFLPTPGRLTEVNWPENVRVDTGYEQGDTVSEYYDGLVAKVVVAGSDRDDAIRRAAAALREIGIEGIRTTSPAALLVLEHDDFRTDRHYTRWLEEQVTLPESFEEIDRQIVAVGGRRFWIPLHERIATASPQDSAPPTSFLEGLQTRSDAASGGDGVVRSPMQGTVVKVLVEPGTEVDPTEVVCVVEAMKMENVVKADVHGVVREINVAIGETVGPGQQLVLIDPKEDA